MKESEKMLRDALFELDVFNGAILSVLVSKKIVTLEEFKSIQEALRPVMNKVSEAKEKEMTELLKKEGLV